MKKIVILSTMALVVLSGCAGNPKTVAQTAEWCSEAKLSSQAFSQAYPGGEMSYKVKGLTTFKGKTACEVEYKIVQEKNTTIISYYFSADGDITYIAKDQSGKVLYEMNQTWQNR